MEVNLYFSLTQLGAAQHALDTQHMLRALTQHEADLHVAVVGIDVAVANIGTQRCGRTHIERGCDHLLAPAVLALDLCGCQHL